MTRRGDADALSLLELDRDDQAATPHRPRRPEVQLPGLRPALPRADRPAVQRSPGPDGSRPARRVGASPVHAPLPRRRRAPAPARRRSHARADPELGVPLRAAPGGPFRAKRRGRAGVTGSIDETSVTGAGRWCYLYRAIDREGALLDSRRRAQRDTHAARRFLRRLVDVAERKPERVTTDPHPPYRRAIRGTLGRTVRHRCNRYLNTRTEQSQRAIKPRDDPMLGFGRFASAARCCSAFAARRQYVRVGQRGAEWVPLAEQRRLVVQRWRSLIAEMTAA